jgi:hypothetical protein
MVVLSTAPLRLAFCAERERTFDSIFAAIDPFEYAVSGVQCLGCADLDCRRDHFLRRLHKERGSLCVPNI